MAKFELNAGALPHGLRTVILPREEGETVTFLVLIGVGSRYETDAQAGLSHFLEHMFFKGTTKRPSTKEISETMDALGGEFNAFTTEEFTGFYVKVASPYLERAADVVSDILLEPLFAAEEIERERGVIKEEIKMYTDMPNQHVWHLWNRAMFGTHPLGRRIDGLAETVSAFQRDDFLNYTKNHYHTGNAVVAVAGHVQTDETKKLLEKLLAKFPQGGADVSLAAPQQMPSENFVFERRASLDQTHLIVGVPGPSLKDSNRWAVEVLATLLGGGMSSRLFLSVRERNGLAYSIRSSAQAYTDTGIFATQAGVRTDKAAQALELIVQEMDRAMTELADETELNKVKQMLRGHMLIELEETNALAAFAGTQALLEKKVETPEEMLAKIEAVTAADVRASAKLLFAPKLRTVALLGPQKTTTDFTRILGI